jgi:hypothetical protein
VMGVVHGFSSQVESLSSAFVLLAMLPVALYVVADGQRRCSIGSIALVLFSIIVALENCFLVSYFFDGYPFTQVDLRSLGPSRLFLNIRDCNFLALIQFQLLVMFFLSGDKLLSLFKNFTTSLRVKAFAGLLGFVSFFNAWLTQGRALLLCLGLTIFLLIYFGTRRRSWALLNFSLVLACSCLVAFGLFEILNLSISSASLGSPSTSSVSSVVDLVQRSDGGRFELWNVWLRSGVSNSLMWGHGFGFIPNTDNLGKIPLFNPHNILVQIFSDSGIFGSLSTVVIAALLASDVSFIGNHRQYALLSISLFPVLIFYLLAAVLFWPAGAWSSCVLIMSVAEYADNSKPLRVDSGGDLRIDSGVCTGIGVALYFAIICGSSTYLSAKKYLFLYTSGWFQ